MANKVLNVRVQLKYDLLANWQSVGDSFIPLKGEICAVEIPASSGAVVQEPAVMFKVGDGSKTFNQLSWQSAVAADVYDWAKAAVKPTYDASEITNLEEFVEEHSVNKEYRMLKVSDSEWKLQTKEADASEWSDVDCDHVNLATALAAKVDKEITGTNGVARIFNESDGGGAKFEHSDGTWSYIGVNDGGADGLAAQIYAVNKDDVNEGVKLNIRKDGIYYLKNKASSALSAEDEIVTKKDIGEISTGMHFIGATTLASGETYEQAIVRLLAEKSHTAVSGDIVIIKSSDSDKEFIYDGSAWIELGDQGLYATKAELQAEAADREETDESLENAITAEATRAVAAEGTKVDKEITSQTGKAVIFNEADGGGAKYEHTDGLESFVGVNNGGESGLAAQIYADKYVNGKWQGAKLDVTNGGMYYTVGDKSFAERAVAANEVAVKNDINTDNLAQGSNTLVLFGGSASEVV